jgi:glycosyltransferase involved in cell wall biosynthesis
MPRLYGLMIAKNEADIVGQSLAHALGHCDKIIAMDNLSTDGTWEVMQDMARRHPGRIVAHCRIKDAFSDGLRAVGYNAFHGELSASDWWLRLDADEFLNEHPAAVIERADDEAADFIRAYQMSFALTDIDVAAIERGEDSRERPIEQRRRFYRVNWREFRLFRNNPAVVWDTALNRQFPQNLSKDRLCSQAIFNRHYSHRDIEQLKARIAVRRDSAAFAHVTDDDWRRYTYAASTQHVWSPDAQVRYAPVRDFWLPRLKLELVQRLGLAPKPV